MASQAYPPITIIKNIIGKFFDYRGFSLSSKGLNNKDIPDYTDDQIIHEMENTGYIRIDAITNEKRGSLDWVVIFVLCESGKYSRNLPYLTKLVNTALSEKTANRLNELIIVADQEVFFGKKPLVEYIKNMQSIKGSPSFDPAGNAPYFNAYPYRNFSLIVPEHVSVPIHTVLSIDESRFVLDYLRISRSDLGIIFCSDPPIVWNGGRPGQIVMITRDSETAGTAITFLRIEKSPQL